MNLSLVTVIALLAIGLAAGLLSGLVGIGGGIVVVPALVLLFQMEQSRAQGTSLAMLAIPIGIVLSVINYYKEGKVDFRFAAIMCVAFIVGSHFGSKIALDLPKDVLKKIFGVLLLILAIKYLFYSK